MNFYFCETCGKRISDTDLDQGLGKNKKLKGVYCKKCAEGIMTVDFVPITNLQAEKLLLFEKTNLPSSKNDLEIVRGTSAPRIVAASRSPYPVRAPIRSIGPTPVVMTTVAAVAVVLVVGGVLALSSNLSRRTPASQPAFPLRPKTPLTEVSRSTLPDSPISDSTTPKSVKGNQGPVVETPEVESPALNEIAKRVPTVNGPLLIETSGVAGAGPGDSTNALMSPPPAELGSTGPAVKPPELVHEIVGLLSQRQFEEAMIWTQKDGSATEATRIALVSALKSLIDEEKALQAGVDGKVGREVRLETEKAIISGKLVAVEYPMLRVEKAILINGETHGNLAVAIRIDELSEASRRSFLSPGKKPDALSHDGWIGRALLALGSGRLVDASAAAERIRAHDLYLPITAEISRLKEIKLEDQARQGWCNLKARAKELSSQALATQLISDLSAYEKEFNQTKFSSNKEVKDEFRTISEEAERIARGLDRRITQLFKGKILSFDPRSEVIRLRYDFADKEQTNDFVGSTWSPTGRVDSTGLIWQKGELVTFCKSPLNLLLQMPQFASDSLSIKIDFEGLPSTKQKLFFVVSFCSKELTGKAPRIDFVGNEKGCHFYADNKPVKSSAELFPQKKGTLEISCYGRNFVAKINGKMQLEFTLQGTNDHTGFCIGGGWDSGVRILRLEVSGRVAPSWLAEALK